MLSTVDKSSTKATMRRPAGKKIKVNEYLAQQIDLCGKSQKEIAAEVGFPKPNIISMLKSGDTKLPIPKVGPMAKALGVDPVFLFRLVMQEYEPETWETIEGAILNMPVISDNEFEIVRILRQSNVPNPKVRTQEERMHLLDAFSRLKPENASRDD